MELLAQVQHWHSEAQYEPIVKLLELLIESSGPMTVGSTKQLALFVYFGDSLSRLKFFRRALRAYQQALSFYEHGSRRASKRQSLGGNCDINTNEYELRHRIHLCHLELHEYREAKTILERIPTAERSIKILSSLAELYSQERNIEKARETLMEILRQDPMRLDCVVKICKLGQREANSILDLIPDDIKKHYPWYPSWVQAQCCLHSANSKQAIRLFESLATTFERKAPILTCLAEAQYHDGNFKEAIRVFQVAYHSDALTLAGVGSYAACLHKESSKRTLEDLAVYMSAKCNIEGEYFHEPWLVLGHYYASNDKKDPKALLFVQKAYKLNRSSVEAIILLSSLCLEKKDPSKAIPYIMTAHTQAPYRYEVQRIICDAFLANNKKPAALTYAKAAIKNLGETARSYYLNADVMLKSQDQRRKASAKSCLEKSVRLDQNFLPAVLAFSELLIDEKKFDKAIDVLESARYHHGVNVDLHKYLYTCYSELKDAQAIFHQNMASELASKFKSSEPSLRTTHEPIASQDDVDPLLAMEADELVDHGDSEA